MRDEDFKKLCELVKKGDNQASEEMLTLFNSLLYKNSYVDEGFSDDIFQELQITLIQCIKKFQFNDKKNPHDLLHLLEKWKDKS